MSSNTSPQNVFLKMPHIFKPLQTLIGVVLAICIGASAGSGNGFLWFVIITSLIVAAVATVIFAMGIQDQIMDSISNGSIQWNIVELTYSFVFAILSLISVWISFSGANQHIGGTSAGYIAAGLFFIVQTAMFAVPCYLIYGEVQGSRAAPEREWNVQGAHPFRDTPYQDL